MTGPIQRGGHFYWEELACHDEFQSPYPADYRETRLPALLDALEAIRDECAREKGRPVPLILTSVYRTPAYQAMLVKDEVYKAAKNSQHVQGRAADILCPRDLTWDQFTACVKRAAAHAGSALRYVEYRPTLNYIHADVRPTQKLVEETV